MSEVLINKYLDVRIGQLQEELKIAEILKRDEQWYGRLIQELEWVKLIGEKE